jgi:ATP-dependent DNA helicase RecG
MPLAPAFQRRKEILATPLEKIRGVGPRIVQQLAKMGIFTVEDALYTLPFRYEDRRQIRKIAHLREGVREVFSGEILAAGEFQTTRSRKKLYEVVVGDGTGQALLKWFHYRREWMQQRFVVGRRVVVTGEVKRFGTLREVHHPDIEPLAPERSLEDFIAADPLSFGRILPVYPLTEGLH